MKDKQLHIAKSKSERQRTRFLLAVLLAIFVVGLSILFQLERGPSSSQENITVDLVDGLVASKSPKTISEIEGKSTYAQKAISLKELNDEIIELLEPLPTFFADVSSIKRTYNQIISSSTGEEPAILLIQLETKIEDIYSAREAMESSLMEDALRGIETGNAGLFQSSVVAMEKIQLKDENANMYVAFKPDHAQYFELYERTMAANSAKLHEEELAELDSMLVLNPPGFPFLERITELRKLVKQSEISSLTSGIEGAIVQGDFDQAELLLSTLAALDPSSDYVPEKALLIASLRITAMLEAAIAQAEEYYANYSYEQASASYRAALDISESNSIAQKGVLETSVILSTAEKLEQLIAQPDRLSDPSVRGFANSVMDEYLIYNLDSPMVTGAITQLITLLDAYAVKRQVTVLSDNKARIEVRSMGYIEPAFERVISLTPGSYQFIAKCNGHIDRAVDIIIPISNEIEPIEVRCGRKL